MHDAYSIVQNDAYMGEVAMGPATWSKIHQARGKSLLIDHSWSAVTLRGALHEGKDNTALHPAEVVA